MTRLWAAPCPAPKAIFHASLASVRQRLLTVITQDRFSFHTTYRNNLPHSFPKTPLPFLNHFPASRPCPPPSGRPSAGGQTRPLGRDPKFPAYESSPQLRPFLGGFAKHRSKSSILGAGLFPHGVGVQIPRVIWGEGGWRQESRHGKAPLLRRVPPRSTAPDSGEDRGPLWVERLVFLSAECEPPKMFSLSDFIAHLRPPFPFKLHARFPKSICKNLLLCPDD